MKKKTMKWLLALAVVGAVAVEGVELYSLHQMEKVFYDMDYTVTRRDLTQLKADVSLYLKNPDSLLVSCSYDPYQAHQDKKVVNASFFIVPKNVTRDMKLELVLDENRYPMERCDNGDETSFQVDVALKALVPVYSACVSITANGQTEIEELDIAVDTIGDYLPKVTGRYEEYNQDEDLPENMYHMNYEVELGPQEHWRSWQDWDLKDMRLVIMENEDPVKEIPVKYDHGKPKSIRVDEAVTIPDGGGTVNLYLMAEDKLGYQHRYSVSQSIFDSEGRQISGKAAARFAGDSLPMYTRQICDKDGKEIYRSTVEY